MRNRGWLQSLIKASSGNRPLAGCSFLSLTSRYFVFPLHRLCLPSSPVLSPHLSATPLPVFSPLCQSFPSRPRLICQPWTENTGDVRMLLIASRQEASGITRPINNRGAEANISRPANRHVNTRRTFAVSQLRGSRVFVPHELHLYIILYIHAYFFLSRCDWAHVWPRARAHASQSVHIIPLVFVCAFVKNRPLFPSWGVTSKAPRRMNGV